MNEEYGEGDWMDVTALGRPASRPTILGAHLGDRDLVIVHHAVGQVCETWTGAATVVFESQDDGELRVVSTARGVEAFVPRVVIDVGEDAPLLVGDQRFFLEPDREDHAVPFSGEPC
jgi:hypothetical protein